MTTPNEPKTPSSKDSLNKAMRKDLASRMLEKAVETYKENELAEAYLYTNLAEELVQDFTEAEIKDFAGRHLRILQRLKERS